MKKKKNKIKKNTYTFSYEKLSRNQIRGKQKKVRGKIVVFPCNKIFNETKHTRKKKNQTRHSNI